MINERVLRFREVRLVGPEGKQIGVTPSREALTMAQQHGLDLVLVSATADPPVCRIIDYGRYKYEQERRERENKRKQQDVKGIKISPRIAEHDMATAIKHATRFLEAGDKVRVTCQFKAREVTHPELGRAKLERIAEAVAELAVVERSPTLDGRLMVMVMVPKPRTVSKAHGKAENKQDGSQKVQDNGQRQDHPAQSVQQSHVPQ
jgi:translation initiation factor IF-3